MSPKKVFTSVLVIFIIASLSFAIYNKFSSAIPQVTQSLKSERVDVFYLHGKARCDACIKIEKYTAETVFEIFEDESKVDDVVFRPIDLQARGDVNLHYIDDFELSFSTVVVARVVNDKVVEYWNLSKVWELTNDEDAMKLYLSNAIQNALGKSR